MIPQGKGVHDGVGVLNLLPQKRVEAVAVDAFAARRAVETAEAAAPERELRQIHKARAIGKGRAEIPDERPQALVPLPQIADDHGVEAVLLFARVKHTDIGRALLRRSGSGLFINGVLRAEDRVTEKVLQLSSPPLVQQILHIGGEPVDHPHTQVVEVLFQKAVRRHVKKMLGCGKLRHILILQRQLVLPDQLQKAVQLRGDEAGIDRVGKDCELRPGKGLRGGAHVLFKAADPRARVEVFKMMLRKALFQIQAALQCHAEAPPRRAVDDQNVHGVHPYT